MLELVQVPADVIQRVKDETGPHMLRYCQELGSAGILFETCDNILTASDAFKHAREMEEMRLKHNGAGIAANQVGLQIPFFIFQSQTDRKVHEVYRPKILRKSDAKHMDVEECLSLPGLKVHVERPVQIEVDFCFQKNGKRRKLVLFGIDACVFQHEFDHLEGITIADYWQTSVEEKVKLEAEKLKQRSADNGIRRAIFGI
jgi:peptide deformylase